jgi:sugar lactone lactonase YvrE
MFRSTLIAAALVAAAICFGCKDDTPNVKTARVGDHPRLNDAQLARAQNAPTNSTHNIEPVALFTGPMPTGVAVSRGGRIFVNFPRWGDPVEFTVAEVKDGKADPYPDLETNRLDMKNQTNGFISVQSVVVDPQDRLWILDTGSINMQPIKPGAAKLLCYDLSSNKLVKRIDFPDNVALKSTYLNDIRFNLKMGKEGVAFITDSSDSGPNGIIVVDLASGTSWRRLNDHPSTKADQNFTPTVEGQPLMAREPGQPPAYLKVGSDGIAISSDGKTLFYCPLAGHKLTSVSTAALADGKMTDEQIAQTVKQFKKDYGSDGLECDANGNLYLTDYEHNAIHRRSQNDLTRDEIIAQEPRMIWPDSMSIGSDGYLYFTANQLNRQKKFHEGKDLRRQPYVMFRTRIDAQPVALGR